ncbi:DNA alkylation repair protein [Thalassococcus sp. S3]|uniref:DNA alkylation repair protein n=1 Tax=Thalassococcus sp. S3 TaxID=2017482 RepID=UPI0010241FF2|nr:DNA alkylation repair protein [Thalassococcus sp. S3]QBF32640.1 hypothetical protein CFI11_15650 [Thalassococcus sp. S3]
MSTFAEVIADLQGIASPDDIDKVARFFKGDPETKVMGVSIGKIFPIAKRYTDLSLADVECLLDDSRYEVRMAGVSILDFKARKKTLRDDERAALYALYIRKHDRINNWDLVDRAAPHVVGEYLLNKDRSELERLAVSDDPHRRRTAIVATHAFLKRGEVDGTFRIAELLAEDADDYVQKAVGSWTREAGKTDRNALIAFLDRNRARLPRPTLTAASKGLPDDIRARLREEKSR